MRTCKVTLKSLSPVMQSRYHNTPALAGEQPGAYEERTWKNKAHVDTKGIVHISPMALSICIKEASKFISRKIPGRGKETWTKHFESGVLVPAPMSLGVHIDDVKKSAIRCSADGSIGGKTKVTRNFPTIDDWKGTFEAVILDDMITEDIFLDVLTNAGNLIGLGTLRVRNRGYCGRFEVVSIAWK